MTPARVLGDLNQLTFGKVNNIYVCANKHIPTKLWYESWLAYLCSVLVMRAAAPKAQLAANRRRTTSIGTNVTSQTRILKKQSPSKCGEIAEMFLCQTRGHAHNVCDLSGGGALPMMSFCGPFTCGWGMPHHDVARAQGATHIDRPIVRAFGVIPQTKTKKENLGTVCLCRIQTFCLLCVLCVLARDVVPWKPNKVASEACSHQNNVFYIYVCICYLSRNVSRTHISWYVKK
jgi:hypothetical protein